MHNRRTFLKTSGHLLIGFSIIESPFRPRKVKSGTAGSGLVRATAGENAIDSWIRVDANGYVTVLTGKMELGQGVKTALMQIAAEELDVNMNRVRIITADTGQTPNERYTAGSASIESSGRSIRNAAAEARRKLLEMAEKKLQVPVSDLAIENGIIQSKGKKQGVSYWELLEGKHIEGEVTGKAPLKDPSTYKLVGSAVPRE
ncbi:MAG TPA: molybdopterin cofactor-binding domain-containing protein, partial [Flavitalea sp.]|nr:molybdopterin cofactor-binding domain-containing protein [Flavitalea sp.]